MQPPGCTSRYTDPGDIVNCILAFNPSSSQAMTGAVSVSPTGHPRNQSNQTVELYLPFPIPLQLAFATQNEVINSFLIHHEDIISNIYDVYADGNCCIYNLHIILCLNGIGDINEDPTVFVP